MKLITFFAILVTILSVQANKHFMNKEIVGCENYVHLQQICSNGKCEVFCDELKCQQTADTWNCLNEGQQLFLANAENKRGVLQSWFANGKEILNCPNDEDVKIDTVKNGDKIISTVYCRNSRCVEEGNSFQCDVIIKLTKKVENCRLDQYSTRFDRVNVNTVKEVPYCSIEGQECVETPINYVCGFCQTKYWTTTTNNVSNSKCNLEYVSSCMYFQDAKDWNIRAAQCKE